MVQQSLFERLAKPLPDYVVKPVSAPYQPQSDTSKAAAKEIVTQAETLRRTVLAFIQKCGENGATDEEGIEETCIPASTYRPRRVECVQAGLVRDSGTTRKVKSGRAATVWVVV